MKTWFVFPDYWKGHVGRPPSFIVCADTLEEALKRAYPVPWDTTFGACVVEAKRCSDCGELSPVHMMTGDLCYYCYGPELVDPDCGDGDPSDWNHSV